MALARLHDDVVLEILAVPQGFSAADCYSAEILAAAVEVADDVRPGWVRRDELGFVVPADVPASKAQLAAHASARQARVADGGIRVAVSNGTVDVASDDKGRGLVTGKVALYQALAASGQPTPPSTWVNDDGASVLVTMEDAVTIGIALGMFIQASYDVLGQALAAIREGTITTYAGIDALPWPVNS